MDSLQHQPYEKYHKILVIGDSCEDIYQYGTCDRLSPEAPVPILKLNRTEIKPGMCMNVAKNLEGLGLKVDVLTHKKKIKKYRFVEEKRLVHLLRVDEEDCPVDSLVWDDVESLLKNQEYDAIVISDYNKGFIKDDLCRKLVEFVDGKTPFFVDTKKQDISCYSGCIVKVNKFEKENIKKFPDSNYELIVTLGEEGAFWNGKIYPTKKSKLYDVCGAGDTFLAALVYSYVSNSSLENSIEFANKCASLSVTHFGNFILDNNDIAKI
jgi:bifunctional ADP-heptose synthase (sugar kinase/adenylyltransferase)